VPDRFAAGGRLASTKVPITHTAAPALYRNQRVGIRAIDVPMRSDGSYLVILYFAEVMGGSPGDRVFDVLARGHRIATVDIARDVGALTPYHLAFTVVVPRHGLAIRFLPHTGQPVLSALQIEPVDPRIQLPHGRQVWSDEFEGPAGTPAR
jgi:hypothetical protein